MASFKKFVESIRMEQLKRFQGRLSIEVRSIKKNNGVLMTGLIGKRPGDNEGLVVYLESYYEKHQEGTALAEIAEEIYDMFNTFEEPGFPLEELGDFEQVRDKIFYKLVNYEKNLEMLQDFPHIAYLDLAIIFGVIAGKDEKGLSICPVSHVYRRKLGKDVGTLYELAKENTQKLFPVSLCSMGQVLETIVKESKGNGMVQTGLEEMLSADTESPLYVLSNTCGVNGASAILYKDVLKDFADMKESDVVLLPSSIHEVLLLPYKDTLDMKNIKEMVEHINKAEVPEMDVLSDNVYLYERERDRITVI